jgi:hypothetical protein
MTFPGKEKAGYWGWATSRILEVGAEIRVEATHTERRDPLPSAD